MTTELSIEQRLGNLPKKFAIPFQQLIAKKLISEETFHHVLDAGELSDNSDKLLGFAIAYLEMSRSQVPIADAIRMAKHQQRKVNLDWSAKRWQSEHDRLSRSEALSQLAKENVEYNLSAYAEHLPEKFSGYLIKSSRRLGMEGLRQRHCVASYHYRVQSGLCAIAVVFVNKQRWTVELFTTGDPEAPLRIGQAKTRLNGYPNQEIRENIYKQLGIPHALSSSQSNSENPSYMDTLRQLLPILREKEIEDINVRFEGYGDSGSIESVDFLPNEKSSILKDPIRYRKVVRNFVQNQGWVNSLEEVTETVDDALDCLTYDYLDQTGVDWFNDDGGYGNLVINVIEGTVSINVNVRFVEASNEYSDELDIVTGEAIN